MAQKTGFLDYLTAAFSARPIGMFVAPNWVGLAAFGLLGLTNPGFWVLGAGLELGYLLTLATNPRFQRVVSSRPLSAARAEWNVRIRSLIGRLDDERSEALRGVVGAVPIDHRPADEQRRGRAPWDRGAGRQPRPPLVDVSAAAGRPPDDL